MVLSSFFPVNSGVGQGCVPASMRLNSYMDWILSRVVVIQSRCGPTLGNTKVNDPDFADDVAILSESLEARDGALDVFTGESKPLGLEVYWTKIQDFRGMLGEPTQLIRHKGLHIPW